MFTTMSRPAAVRHAIVESQFGPRSLWQTGPGFIDTKWDDSDGDHFGFVAKVSRDKIEFPCGCIVESIIDGCRCVTWCDGHKASPYSAGYEEILEFTGGSDPAEFVADDGLAF